MLVACSRIGSMSKRFISEMLVLAVCLCLWNSRATAAESPQTVVQSGTDHILKILKKYPQDTPTRREQIRAVIDGYFDFEAIARLAVGPRWRGLTPENRQEFTQEFSKLLFNTYIGDIEEYAGQRITYTNRSIFEGYVAVEAHVEDRSGPVTIDYYLHLRDGNWKVYDVAVAGLSLAANYRDQFSSVLANGSFEDLSMMLRQKIAQICRTGRC